MNPPRPLPELFPVQAQDLHLSYQQLHADVAESQWTPLSGSGGWEWWKICALLCTCLLSCMCERVCAVDGWGWWGWGGYPQTQVAQFFGKSLAHPGGKSRRRRWWGEGTKAFWEQSLISNLPKTGAFMLWCWGPLLCREMLSQRCNIHLCIGPGGGCIGLQCCTKYPRALTSLMKSLLAAVSHYCILLCLSLGDFSLCLPVFFCQLDWLPANNSWVCSLVMFCLHIVTFIDLA